MTGAHKNAENKNAENQKIQGTRILALALVATLVAALVAGFFWIRSHYFEQRTSAVPYQSGAAQENPMLAATRLLEKHQFKVRQSESLDQALSPDLQTGHLFIGNTSGEFNPAQAKQVLAWVNAGNTLIMQPRFTGVRENESASKQECIKTDKPDKPDRPQAESVTKPAAEATGKDGGGGQAGGDGTDAEKKQGDANPPDEEETYKTGRDTNSPFDTPSGPPSRSELNQPDPISARLGVEIHRVSRPFFRFTPFSKLPHTACVTEVYWPNLPYALRMDSASAYLVTLHNSAPAFIGDRPQQALRVYREGKGHIVILANNYFNNENLALYDHAQLLLHLSELNPVSRALVIIQQLQVRQWYEKLWDRFYLLLLSAALGLALLLWQNVRRFGPLLPLPEPNRRALMEHIDASGRWLWKIRDGNQVLLDAMRTLTHKTLHRRLPKLARLAPGEQIECLLQDTKINRNALELALQRPAAAAPLVFIRQIHTLQRLRKHYER